MYNPYYSRGYYRRDPSRWVTPIVSLSLLVLLFPIFLILMLILILPFIVINLGPGGGTKTRTGTGTGTGTRTSTSTSTSTGIISTTTSTGTSTSTTTSTGVGTGTSTTTGTGTSTSTGTGTGCSGEVVIHILEGGELPQALAYSPNPAFVCVDQSVRWVNDATIMSHTATSDDDPAVFDTGILAPGAQSLPFVFNAAGTYNYHCTLHPTMLGTVVVQ